MGFYDIDWFGQILVKRLIWLGLDENLFSYLFIIFNKTQNVLWFVFFFLPCYLGCWSDSILSKFVCEEYFAHWAYWSVFLLKKVWVGDAGMPNAKSGKYHFFISVASCVWTRLLCIWLSHDFWYLLYKFVNGWF